MRVLVMTKIFPNQREPGSSPFNRLQFAALSRLCPLDVLATIPWFPGGQAFQRWSPAARLSDVPQQESIDGLSVRHPRFLYLPRVGHGIAGALYAASLAPTVLRYRGRVDVLLGSWAYPDGFAAVVLAGLLGVPAVVKVHGSDLNVLAELPGPRRRMEWALPRAARVVAVSRPLGEVAASLGVERDRIDIVKNGIDRELFRPRDRAAARRALGLPADVPIVLYVGHLAKAKGALDLIRAFSIGRDALGGAQLVMLGDGADQAACRDLCAELGVRASLVGAQPHARVPEWLAACDLLALPSWAEGTPNVVLEALASGRRVVASSVGGIPDVIDKKELGALVPPRDPAALASALAEALQTPYDPEQVSNSLPWPDWEGSARALHQSLLAALEDRARDTLARTYPATQAA
ncbi:MAG TPA: glycosyltransferase family 4 protein [Polyangiaceae bacterium]